MDMRRRRHGETADEKLDRLIEMERRAREQPAQPTQRPEVRRLKVMEGSAGASAGDGQVADEPQLALQLGQEVPAPEGLLAPLFDDVATTEARVVQTHRMDAGDSSRSTAFGGQNHGLQLEPYHGADQGQGSGHRDGSDLSREAGGPFGRNVEQGATGDVSVPPGINVFWSPEVKRAVMEEQSMAVERPQDLPPLAGPPVTFGPVQALGNHHGRPGHLPPGVAAGHVGPVQAPLQSSPGVGPEQAGLSSAGPVQAHGAECQRVGTEQALASTTCSGLGQALGDGILSQPSPERGLEELRLRIVREAERSFIREARKLKGDEADGEVRSYHTASSGPGAASGPVPPMPAMQTAPMSPGVEVHPGGQCRALQQLLVTNGHTANGGFGQSASVLGDHGMGVGWTQRPLSAAMNSPGTPGMEWSMQGQSQPMQGQSQHGVGANGLLMNPPGLSSGLGQSAQQPLHHQVGGGMSGLGGAATTMQSEPMRSSDLPLLQQPGTEQSALQFGDWITVVTPLVGDVAGHARGWWNGILRESAALYDKWLTSTPLERIRLRPAEVQLSEGQLRLEQKVVPMILKSVPETIKQDLIASRTMTVTGIMYRLWTIFQPGGSSERVSILRQLTEPKVAGGAPDLLSGLRRWRRLMSRSIELNLALPDPVILGGVLHRFADALAKLGGTQLAYRVASVRQELAVDVRPSALSIEQYAEYLQAEAEELSLGIGVKATTAGAAAGTTLKAMMGFEPQGSMPQGTAGTSLQKSPCRFWKTTEGCRRGAQCTFFHDTTEMKGRCYKCGGTSHMRKDCPVKSSSASSPPATSSNGAGGDGAQPKKVAKVKAGMKSKSSPESVKEKPLKEQSAEQPMSKEPTGGESTATEPMGEPSTEAAAELMKEATSLLKSIRSIKAVRMQSVSFGESGDFALLDGGATHGLREARPEEYPDLIPTRVELACGHTMLHKHPKHQTLLSTEPVEPIIPLAWLVAAGYKITWKRESIVIHHPERGPLKCSLRGGCPVLTRGEGLSLLGDLERLQQGETEVKLDELGWWSERFSQVPGEVWKYMKGQGENWKDIKSNLPWNRHQRKRMWRSKGVVLHLFAGKNLKPWKDLEQSGYMVLSIDVLHGVDLHDAAVWAFLWELAVAGKLVAVFGGPPCRTTSRLRQRRPGPPPLRGRGPQRFALEDLSMWDLHRVHGDTALLFKQIGLFLKAEERRMQVPELQGLPVAFALESPEDPVEYLGMTEATANLPSFWDFPELQNLVGISGLSLISFDQGETGHQRRKPTSILGNLPQLQELHGLRCSEKRSDPLPATLQDTMDASKEWAAWSPGLVAALRTSMQVYLDHRDQLLAQRLKKMNMDEWKKHVLAQHRPYRRDCRRCLELAGVDSPHRRTHNDSSAYCLSIDIVGPYPIGKDDGRKRPGKYILVGTVPLPRLERAPQPAEEKDEKNPVVGAEVKESEEQCGSLQPNAEDPNVPEDPVSEDPNLQNLEKELEELHGSDELEIWWMSLR